MLPESHLQANTVESHSHRLSTFEEIACSTSTLPGIKRLCYDNSDYSLNTCLSHTLSMVSNLRRANDLSIVYLLLVQRPRISCSTKVLIPATKCLDSRSERSMILRLNIAYTSNYMTFIARPRQVMLIKFSQVTYSGQPPFMGRYFLPR